MQELKLFFMFLDSNIIKLFLSIDIVLILDILFTNNSHLIKNMSLIIAYLIAIYKFLSLLVELLKIFALWGVCKNEK